MPAPWIDISLPVAPDSVAWEGLARPRLRFVARIDAGAAVNVGQLDCSLHTGTHADAPLHVLADGAAVDRLDPALFVGPATVIRTANPDAITRDDLRACGVGEAAWGGPAAARVLVATPSQYDGVRFPAAVPHLTPDAAGHLAALGVRLIGVNVPSLDPLDSRGMAAHRVVFAAGMGVIENLDLRGVPAGTYDLVAAPVRVVGADAAPVRALLRRRRAVGRPSLAR